MDITGQHHTAADLQPRGKILRCPFSKKLDGSRSWSGRFWRKAKSLAAAGKHTWQSGPLPGHYTDYRLHYSGSHAYEVQGLYCLL